MISQFGVLNRPGITGDSNILRVGLSGNPAWFTLRTLVSSALTLGFAVAAFRLVACAEQTVNKTRMDN